MSWYVVRTVPGQQLRAMAEFSEMKLEAYCPMMKREIRHHQTKKWMLRTYPLFSGYAFASLHGDADFNKLYRMKSVHAVLGGDKGPIPVPFEDINTLLQEEARGAFDVMRPPGRPVLKQADRVMITSGPLQGHYGSITTASGKRSVRMLVESIADMREININVAKVELVA